MRKQVLTFVIGFAIAVALFGGTHVTREAPVASLLAPVAVEAQATTTKSDLITLYRANAKFFIDWKDANKALRAQYDAHAFTWANGDFVGSNEGILATEFTTAVTNLSLVQAAFDSGGTLSAGFPTTVYKIK